MTQQDDSTVMKFKVMVGGDYQSFEMDINEQTFTGTETLLIDQYAGDFLSWAQRWANKQPRGSDVVLLAFLATRRAQAAEHGAATVVWDEFAELIRPYSLRVPGEATAPKANRAEKRAAARSGSPATRATA